MKKLTDRTRPETFTAGRKEEETKVRDNEKLKKRKANFIEGDLLLSCDRTQRDDDDA